MNLNDTRALAELLMEKHGIDKQGWRFKFDNSVKRFGLCSYANRAISLSRHLCLANDESSVENTILHEIAHALVGPSHGHDSTWKFWAKSIGCDGSRLYGSEVARPQRAWKGTCPENPEHTTQSHRRGRLACKRCCKAYNRGKFTEQFLFTWSENQ